MATALRERLTEADAQIERRGVVWDTLRRVVEHLEREKLPYVVVGGLALQHYGVQRSTQDVELLIAGAEELEEIHRRLIGRGYQRKSATSRHLRDDVTRVRIEFLLAGEFPGDDKLKPVQFPDPAAVAERSSDAINVVNLRSLIELKLASAKSAPQRIKDRADVLELIHLLPLPPDFADQLNPYVQAEFRELAALPPPYERD